MDQLTKLSFLRLEKTYLQQYTVTRLNRAHLQVTQKPDPMTNLETYTDGAVNIEWEPDYVPGVLEPWSHHMEYAHRRPAAISTH